MFVFLFCNRRNGWDIDRRWRKNQPSTIKLTLSNSEHISRLQQKLRILHFCLLKSIDFLHQVFVFLFCNRQNGLDSARCRQKNQPSTHKHTFLRAFRTRTQKRYLYEISGTFNTTGHTTVPYTTENNILIRHAYKIYAFYRVVCEQKWFSRYHTICFKVVSTYHSGTGTGYTGLRSSYHVVWKTLVVLKIPSARQSYAHHTTSVVLPT